MGSRSRGPSIGKIVVFLLVAGAVWNWGIPWYRKTFPNLPGGGGDGKGSSSTPDGAWCAEMAERASLAWGGGVGRFVNPPFDQSAWSVFKGEIDKRISDARDACWGSLDSCRKAKEALYELDGLVTQLDAAIRSGATFTNEAVRQQERIDAMIEEAKSLARQGK